MNKLLFSLLTFALFTGCYRVSDKIQPKIDYQIQDNYLKRLPPAFKPITSGHLALNLS